MAQEAINRRGSGATDTVNGMFKERYGDLQDLTIRQFQGQRMWTFREAESLGDSYKEVALLQNEHGVTYAAPTDDAFTLNASIAGQTKEVTVQGSQHVIRSQVGFNAVASAKKSEEAFRNVFDVVVGNSTDSLRKRVEVDLWYGQDSLATIAGVAGNVLTLDTAEFAPGIWSGSEGALLQIFPDSSGNPGATARSGGDATISAVDIEARTVTLVTMPGGVLATDHVLFNGQWDGTNWKTQVGLHVISGSPTTIFGIATASFSLWDPSQYSVGSGPLIFSKVNKASVRAINRGFMGDMDLCINPSTWADLLNDEAALRRHNSMGASQIDVGGDGIKFHVAAGTITIRANIYVKEGFGYMCPSEGAASYRRIGATDVTPKPIDEGETFLERVAGVAAYELLLYDNQALYTSRPAYTVQLNNIVNAA